MRSMLGALLCADPARGDTGLQQAPDGLRDDSRGQRGGRTDGQRPVERPVTHVSYGANGTVADKATDLGDTEFQADIDFITGNTF